MRTNDKAKKFQTVPREQLDEIKEQILQLNPQIRNVTVIRYYNGVKARAKLGCRNIFVRCGKTVVFERFVEQYLERLPTAFSLKKTKPRINSGLFYFSNSL